VSATVRAFWVLGRRPARWGGAVRAAWRFAAPRWWRHPPFLPVPDPAWWTMRCEVACGVPDARFDDDEMVGFVRWVSQMRRWTRR